MIMAETNETSENAKEKSQRILNNDESESTESIQPLVLDLGDDLNRLTDSHRLGIQSAGASGNEFQISFYITLIFFSTFRQ